MIKHSFINYKAAQFIYYTVLPKQWV